MLETIINPWKKALYTAGLTLGLYTCGGTTNVTNNYFYGRDGGEATLSCRP